MDFPEFLVVMSKMKNTDNADKELYEAFCVFDKDGNGFISPDEMNMILTSLGTNIPDDDLEELMEEADIDGDGQINYEGTMTELAVAHF